MERKKDIRYTKEAELRIDWAKEQFQEKIESLVAQWNYQPGEKLIEITASDVEAARNHLDYGSANPRAKLRDLMYQTYGVLGGLLVVFGIFFETFNRQINDNPIQAILVMFGAAVMVAALLLRQLTLVREQLERSRHEAWVGSSEASHDDVDG